MNNTDEKNKSILAKIWNVCSYAVYSALAFLFIFCFILSAGTVSTTSMGSTLKVGENVIVNRLAYVTGEPSQGDIVVFNSEENDELIIRRVIGVSGDIIDIIEGSVYVNGCKLTENYLTETTTLSANQITHFEVPEDSVFLLGDNREHFNDSRIWNNPYITYDKIIGKACINYSINQKLGYYAKWI